MGFLLPVEFAQAGGRTLAVEGRVEAIEHEGLADALDRGQADLQRLADGVVWPSGTGRRAIGFE